MFIAGAGAQAGQQIDHLVNQLDLTPTLNDLCQLESEQVFHGKSPLPLLDAPETDWRQGMMTQHYRLHERLPQRAWYQGDLKLVLQQDGFVELYCLSDDPGEMDNLAASTGQAETLTQMRQALFEAMTAVVDVELIALKADSCSQAN